MSKALILIGMAGSGKTTVGREAARLLGRPFVDLDEVVERRFGPISKLFEQGEAYFRQCETEAVAEVCSIAGAVIATGGGVVTQPKNMELLRQAGVILFLDRPIHQIVADIDLSTRPLYVCGVEALNRTYQTRLPLYRQYADHIISNSGGVEEACNQIKRIAKGEPT